MALALFARAIDSLDRNQAAVLYASAIAHARRGDRHIAKGFAEQCILLLRDIGSHTVEDCATEVSTVGGVAIPDFLHEEVVRQRLGAYQIPLVV